MGAGGRRGRGGLKQWGAVRGLRDAAFIAVMSDGLLRVSEAAALEVADLEAEGANTLTIRRSKTDQEGEGAVQYIGGPTVARVRAWLAAAGITGGPMFQRLDKAGRRGRLSTVSVRAIVQRRAAEAGIEGRVSGHSLRVGGAQSLAAAGASIVEMQTAGRWQSPSMPGRARPAASSRPAARSPGSATGHRERNGARHSFPYVVYRATMVGMAIKGFKHAGLKRLFDGNDGRRLPQDRLKRITDILDNLHQASVVADTGQPGYRLHPLKGDRRGYWSVRVSANWRIAFRFERGNVYDVDLIDYH